MESNEIWCGIYVWGNVWIASWFKLLWTVETTDFCKNIIISFYHILLPTLCCNLKLNFLKNVSTWSLHITMIVIMMLINLNTLWSLARGRGITYIKISLNCYQHFFFFLLQYLGFFLKKTSSGVHQNLTFFCGIIWIVNTQITPNTFSNTGRLPYKFITAVMYQ